MKETAMFFTLCGTHTATDCAGSLSSATPGNLPEYSPSVVNLRNGAQKAEVQSKDTRRSCALIGFCNKVKKVFCVSRPKMETQIRSLK